MLGGIQHMVAELRTKGRQPLAGLVEGCFVFTAESHTALLHGQQFRREDSSLCGAQRCLGLALERKKGAMQQLALTETVAETHNLWLLGCVGFPQFRRVADSVQMGDHSPTPTQSLTDALQRVHHGGPGQATAC